VLFLPFACGISLSLLFKCSSMDRHNCYLLYFLIKILLFFVGFALGCAANVIAIPIAVVIVLPSWLIT
jgi:hypothetical protein